MGEIKEKGTYLKYRISDLNGEIRPKNLVY